VRAHVSPATSTASSSAVREYITRRPRRAPDQRLECGHTAERKWREASETEAIPAVAPDGGDVAMPLPEAYEFYGTPRGQVANY
jgi:hypothetical protein